MRAAAVVREIGRRQGGNAGPDRARLAAAARATTSCRFPGTKRRRYLEENVAAVGLTLTRGEMDQLDAALPPEAVAGNRYNERMMTLIDR